MKRVKLDHTEMEKEVQNQSSEEDQTVPNTLIIKNDGVEKLGPLFRAVKSGDYENFALHLCFEESRVAENVREYNEFLKFCSVFLHIAAENGHVECLQILIDHGVNVNTKDEFTCTALHKAAKIGHLQCLKTLLLAGADCSARIIVPSYKMNFHYIPGSTALHLAARCNHIDCVKELIQYGTDRNIVDENGDTSLYIAVEYGFNECALAHLSDLSNFSHDRRFLSLPSFSSSNTPLHVAIENGMLDCVKELVHLGSDVNHINKYSKSPLHVACSSKILQDVELKLKILKLLILEGHYTDMNNALHPIFVDYYDTETKLFLITYGANVDFKVENIGTSYFEYELMFHKGSPKLLKYIMNCMPRLPFLHALRLYPIADTLPKHNTVWHSSVLPKNVTFRLVRGQKNMYVEMSNIEDELENERVHFIDTFCNQPLRKLILLQQPFLNLLYDNINKELKEMDKLHSTFRTFLGLPSRMSNFSHKDHFVQLRQHLWYQKMASSPQTLMHHCRFSIRKSMGPSNIIHINKLPLPEKLQSYLLFENESDEIDWDS